MKTILILLALCMAGCDPEFSLTLPDIQIPDIPAPCLLPPGDCALSYEAFEQMFSVMTDAEQEAYVQKWAEPASGFVSLSARIYGGYSL